MDTVTTDAITREVTIGAAPETVWRIITEPEHIMRWWFAKAEFEAVAGASGRITFRPGYGEYPTELAVVAAEPPTRLAYRWGHAPGETADETNSLLVEFALEPVGDQTLLRVTESGLSTVAWGAEQLAAYTESHEFGWHRHLLDLASYVAWL